MIESIGQQLQAARQARQITLEEAARATHIRARYLQALEADQSEALPSRVQARGFLGAYADYLGLNRTQLLALLENHTEDGEPDASIASPQGNASQAGRQAEAALEPANVELIFKEIGLTLKRQRELLGLALEDIERQTHVRQFYLTALEAGQWHTLPSTVQGRGMLKNYADFLGLDPDPLLLRFAEGLQARLAARREVEPASRPRRAARRARPQNPALRLLSAEFLIGAVLVVALVGFIGWGAIRIFSLGSAQAPEPTAPSISEVLLEEPTPSATATLAPPTPSPAAPIALPPPTEPLETLASGAAAEAGEQGSVRVYLTVRQRTWVQISVDDEIAFAGRLLPGNAYQYAGDERVEILTGNAAGLQVFYNQQDLGALGLFGQVVHLVFTANGVQTPTPTVTFTPTATAPPSATAQPSPTATP